MVILYLKHFGDKVFLCDLDQIIVSEMLKMIPTDIKKIPIFGVLDRFSDGMVGLSVWYVGKYGHMTLLKEPTTHKTIYSWGKYHMQTTTDG